MTSYENPIASHCRAYEVGNTLGTMEQTELYAEYDVPIRVSQFFMLADCN